MARVIYAQRPVDDMSAEEQRAEYNDMRAREELWHRLKTAIKLECEEDETPIVLMMLERWVLLDQYRLPPEDAAHAKKRLNKLRIALDKLETTAYMGSRAREKAERAFATKATDCAQSWAANAYGVPGANFNANENAWIKASPANAVEECFGPAMPAPDLSSARTTRTRRKDALRAALGEDEHEERSAPSAATLGGGTESRKRRVILRVSSNDNGESRKRARVETPSSDSGEDVLSGASSEDEDEGEDEVAGESNGASKPPASTEDGIVDGSEAYIACVRCRKRGHKCRVRLVERAPRVPGACARCSAQKEKCEGAVWKAPESPQAASPNALRAVGASVGDLDGPNVSSRVLSLELAVAGLGDKVDVLGAQLQRVEDMLKVVISAVAPASSS
ncbi:hypothetical protein EXIGLDRAFT_765167 [Exidia glandulosa HHB12029]|uniref:Zn(2)-C6 fungal-type domain-containing protein n=1 Tax=Exidia glandulosa HHB12029 TaxID=1314781 RepID=A0A165KP78_EXIGL|nr:hypothetical protein EXIGLDRAFT_765167 [Exidia glandulosa HHB12029]